MLASPTRMKYKVDPTETPEKLAAVRNIRRLMAFWDIQPDELQGVEVIVRPPPPPPTVRYRHPITHDAWDGVGAQPEWLRLALLREGYTVDELRRCAAETSSA